MCMMCGEKTRDRVEFEYKLRGYVLVEASNDHTLLKKPNSNEFVKINYDGTVSVFESLNEW